MWSCMTWRSRGLPERQAFRICPRRARTCWSVGIDPQRVVRGQGDRDRLPRRQRGHRGGRAAVVRGVADALAGVEHGVLAHAEDVLVLWPGDGHALVEVELGHLEALGAVGL